MQRADHGLVWLNGRIVPAADARVSVFDAGFLHGIGWFETLRAYNGRAFRLDAHIERLRRSAAALGWVDAPTPESLHAAVDALLNAAHVVNARVRLTVTPGTPELEGSDGQATVVVTTAAVDAYPAAWYETGVAVALADVVQSCNDLIAGHKTVSYAARRAALARAAATGRVEALWETPTGELAEGSVSNVFVVLGDELWTPPVETPVLPGVARDVVLGLARAAAVKVREEPLAVGKLESAAEVFLTNSVMEVLPVVQVERWQIANGTPGPTTLALRAAYVEAVRRECA